MARMFRTSNPATMNWTRFSNPAGAHRAPPTSVNWGSPYGGSSSYVTRDGQHVWMFRKGQKVRFFDAQGAQVGPEQTNVGPAVAFAYSMGWADEELLRMGVRPHPDDPTFKSFSKLAKNPSIPPGPRSRRFSNPRGAEMRVEHTAFRISPARFAKGMVAVRPLDSVEGYKGRTSFLLGDLNARWSNREGAYIVSPTKARKFIEIY